MATATERAVGLAELDALNSVRRQSLIDIRAKAKAAVEAGNFLLADDLKAQEIRLSAMRANIAKARDRILLHQSLAGPIAALRALTTEASTARQNLAALANALHAAQRIVDIFRRLPGIFN